MKAIIYIIILSFSVQAFARGGADKGFRVLDELNLSNEQIAKIEQFKSEHKKKRETKKTKRENHREKMKELFLDGASDEEMKKYHKVITEHKNGRSGKRLEKMIFIKNLLNKEQRKLYLEKKKGRRKN